MSAKYLLDTNVLSEPLRPVPNRKVLQRLRKFEGLIVTSSLVWHELRYGARRIPESKKRRTIEEYLDSVVGLTVPILAYDQAAAAWHAFERARLEKDGRAPAFVNGQIASTAKVNGLILVTRNVRNYTSFDGLTVENWHR